MSAPSVGDSLVFVDSAVGTAPFEAFRRQAMATFYLPDRQCSEEPDEGVDWETAAKAIETMPFPCVQIVQRELLVGDFQGEILTGSLIVERVEGSALRFLGVDVTTFGTRYYTGRPGSVFFPPHLLHLVACLDDRRSRFVEQSVSRQVRRSMGVTKDYREYAITYRDTISLNGYSRKVQSDELLTFAQVARKHPCLHAVRAHLRHYRSGKVVVIRSHARGGEDGSRLLQVKDYDLREVASK